MVSDKHDSKGLLELIQLYKQKAINFFQPFMATRGSCVHISMAKNLQGHAQKF